MSTRIVAPMSAETHQRLQRVINYLAELKNNREIMSSIEPNNSQEDRDVYDSLADRCYDLTLLAHENGAQEFMDAFV